MVKLFKTVRKDIFSWDGYEFQGQFSPDCRKKALPTNLKELVSMLLNGSNILDQKKYVSQASLTIAQLIMFTAKNAFRSKEQVFSPWHSKCGEPPILLAIPVGDAI